MRFCVLILLLCPTAFLSQSSPSPAADDGPRNIQSAPVADRLIGTWRLVGSQTKRANGEVIYPFYGKHPEGLLIYDRSGYMSVQIVSDPKPSLPTASSREKFLAAPNPEKIAAVDCYYAYCGTWTLDSSDKTITHHIKQSLYPGERGEEALRRIILEGNTLTLIAKTHEMGEDHERVLIWERVAPASP